MPHFVNLFSPLIDLLKQAMPTEFLSIEPLIFPVILGMWALHVSDPFVSIDALDILEEIKKAPGCIHPLVSRILPYVGPILNKPQQPDGLVAGSLDLVAMFSKVAKVKKRRVVEMLCLKLGK